MLNFSSPYTSLHFKFVPYSGWSPIQLPSSFVLVLTTVTPSAQSIPINALPLSSLPIEYTSFSQQATQRHLSICKLAWANQMVQQCENLPPICLQHDPTPVSNTCFQLCLILSPFINCTVFIFTTVSSLPKTSLKLLHIPEIYALLHPWNVVSSGN